MILIFSLSNKKIKNIINLQKKVKNRNLTSQFVVEGIKEIKMAINANYEIVEFFICKEIFIEYKKFLLSYSIKNVTIITPNIFKKISYRKNSGGIIGIYKKKKLFLEEINLKKNSIILILDEIEKPGNLGAVLRTADAAGIDLVILNNPKIDLFNSNVIRSSLGTIFTVNIIIDKFNRIIKWIKKKKNIKIITTSLSNKYNLISKNIYKTNLKENIAIIIGSEKDGICNDWENVSDCNIRIPMMGKSDSLNLSIAACIIIYESLRQKFYNRL